MFKKQSIVLAVAVGTLVQNVSALVIFSDHFDYANDTALQAAWSGTGITLDLTNGLAAPSAIHNGSAAVHQPIGLTFNLTPTDAIPVVLRADIFNTGAGNQRNSVGLRTGANPLFE